MAQSVNVLTEKVIGCAIEVHRNLGPGLLESAYRECLVHELKLRGLDVIKERELPVIYKGIVVDCVYRIDLIVENACDRRTEDGGENSLSAQSPAVDVFEVVRHQDRPPP